MFLVEFTLKLKWRQSNFIWVRCMYRLVHIDADKSFDGTYHDLELTFKKARVVLVGDIGLDSDERSARDAVLRFATIRKILSSKHIWLSPTMAFTS